VTIDTESRRKEMAIRKINGAGVRQIAMLFARFYIILLALTAVLGFALVEFLLRALSGMYTVFFHHGAGFYLCIFLLVSLFVAITVAFRIWQVSRVNPAEEIKRE
jgi:putative ABC transport system permease protein